MSGSQSGEGFAEPTRHAHKGLLGLNNFAFDHLDKYKKRLGRDEAGKILGVRDVRFSMERKEVEEETTGDAREKINRIHFRNKRWTGLPKLEDCNLTDSKAPKVQSTLIENYYMYKRNSTKHSQLSISLDSLFLYFVGIGVLDPLDDFIIICLLNNILRQNIHLYSNVHLLLLYIHVHAYIVSLYCSFDTSSYWIP